MRASKEELIQRGVLRAQDFSPPLGNTSHDFDAINRLGEQFHFSFLLFLQILMLNIHSHVIKFTSIY